jgi:hypothetical protein
VKLTCDRGSFLVHGDARELLALALGRGCPLLKLADVTATRLCVRAQSPDADAEHDDDDRAG